MIIERKKYQNLIKLHFELKNNKCYYQAIKKKEGVIIINKKVFFLIFILVLIFKVTNVKAINFYEAEYLDNIYMSKYNKSNQTIYFQKARFFRRSDTNQFAYCIEPLTFFTDSQAYYEPTITPRNLSAEQIKRISQIAHFGYLYPGHEEIKWYAITQIMIWQEADKYNDFYFTQGLNGPKIYPYQEEINSINKLIEKFEKMPNLEKEYHLVKNSHFSIFPNDKEVLENLRSDNKEITVTEDRISIKPLDVGEYNFSIYKHLGTKETPPIFYQSATSQNLMETGDIETNKLDIKVIIVQPKIKIYKEDEETGKTPQGQAQLDGTTIKVYKRTNLLGTYEIKDNKILIDNLQFGTYYIEEEKPGEGYELNNERYKIELTKNNYEQSIIIKNKVIKKEIKIVKKYGTENNLENESNIEFDIFDINNNLVNTIITNENGEASIILPYGEYTIVQKNTTEGYKINYPFNINVNSNEAETIELKDLRIPVPNTKTSLFKTLIKYLLRLLC